MALAVQRTPVASRSTKVLAMVRLPKRLSSCTSLCSSRPSFLIASRTFGYEALGICAIKKGHNDSASYRL